MSARETADLESILMGCPPLAEGVLIDGERRDDGYYVTVRRSSSGFACILDDSKVSLYFLDYPDGSVGAELSIEHRVVEGFLQRLGREPLYLYEERTWTLSAVRWLEFGDGFVPSAFIGRKTMNRPMAYGTALDVSPADAGGSRGLKALRTAGLRRSRPLGSDFIEAGICHADNIRTGPSGSAEGDGSRPGRA